MMVCRLQNKSFEVAPVSIPFGGPVPSPLLHTVQLYNVYRLKSENHSNNKPACKTEYEGKVLPWWEFAISFFGNGAGLEYF
jgi:hypothetical protein